ncbi:ABC transporter ATP-binding protein [Bacillaceae bacterium Marseille-Q3522]|nr:ABC transporter ATP-binding protein [Bacillaceae bacterium Marseille-Q3522]
MYIRWKDLRQKYFQTAAIHNAFTLLKPFLMQQWKPHVMMFILLLLEIGLTFAYALFFGKMTDAAITNEFHAFTFLIPFGILLFLLSMASNYFSIYFESMATNGVKTELKNMLFHHILRLPAKETANLRSGELITYFSADIHQIHGMIGTSLLELVRLPLIYGTVFVYLWHLNWTLALITVLIAPVAILAGLIFGVLLRNNSREIHELTGKVNSYIADSFHGLAIIRSFTLEHSRFHYFQQNNKRLNKLELKNAKLRGLFSAGGEMASSLTFLICLSLGAVYVSNGVMTIGALITFTNLVNHLVYPLTGLAGRWAGFQRSVTAVARLIKLLEKQPDYQELPAYKLTKRDFHSIYFDHLDFCYEENLYVFKKFHLQIPAGTMTAFVGPSGAGKTTLIQLLQGFYKPQEGRIYIGKHLLTDFSPSELRSMIANVPQETYLFSGSIRENLLLANPDATDKDMIQAAKQARIHDFILTLPEAYETAVGERGINFSGGQRQRLAIARALLKNAPILLFDEATSALDPDTENSIKQTLEQIRKDRTILVIAHRLSTVQHADCIIVMDNGKVVQNGTHEELIAQEGLYQNWHQQAFLKQMGQRRFSERGRKI